MMLSLISGSNQWLTHDKETTRQSFEFHFQRPKELVLDSYTPKQLSAGVKINTKTEMEK